MALPKSFRSDVRQQMFVEVRTKCAIFKCSRTSLDMGKQMYSCVLQEKMTCCSKNILCSETTPIAVNTVLCVCTCCNFQECLNLLHQLQNKKSLPKLWDELAVSVLKVHKVYASLSSLTNKRQTQRVQGRNIANNFWYIPRTNYSGLPRAYTCTCKCRPSQGSLEYMRA